MTKIYSVSAEFRQEIAAVEKKVQNALDSGLSLCETITLPDFGQHVILRFEVAGEVASLTEIDQLETSLKEIVGQDYWAALVGAVYLQVLPEHFLAELPARLEQLSHAIPCAPTPVSSSPYAERIQKDAEVIRSHLGLEPECRIWEIESAYPENEAPTIRVITGNPDPPQPGFVFIGQQQFQVELLPRSATYATLLSVYGLASQNRKALLHYLYEATGP